jgi:hypothetical protein
MVLHNCHADYPASTGKNMKTNRTSVKRFSKSMRDGIELVRSMLTQDFKWPVVVKYARDEHTGTPFVEFIVDAVPAGSIAQPGPIGVLRLQASSEGTRYEVANAYGATVLDGLTASQALKLSRYLVGTEGPGLFDADGRRLCATEAERAAHGLGRDEDDEANGFSATLRERLDNLRGDISRTIGWPVAVYYGVGDEEPTEQWAAFSLDVAPDGALPVSVCIGNRVQGFAAILGTDPRQVLRHVEDEKRFYDDDGLYWLIHDTVVAEFKRLTSRRRRASDDAGLVALASGPCH